MEPVYKKGFDFGFNPSACKECPGYCCCGRSGYVWVSAEEIESISVYLKEKTVDFINRYLIYADNRLSLKEDYREEEGFVCVFFDSKEKGCRIYPVRPSQCRRYPFWPGFRDNPEQARQNCPGVTLP